MTQNKEQRFLPNIGVPEENRKDASEVLVKRQQLIIVENLKKNLTSQKVLDTV